MEMDKAVKILYTNNRDETAVFNIIPSKIWFGETSLHSEKQWILDAFEIEKQTERPFALKNIRAWYLE